MRLNDHIKDVIISVARRRFGEACRVVLFGSRTDDAAKGGDIDLYIRTELSREDAFRSRIRFIVDLEREIGERNIDVVVQSSDSTHKPIFDIAEKSGVVIT